MVYVLFAALAAGAAIGGVNSLASSNAKPAADPVPAAIAPDPGSRQEHAPAQEQASVIEGQVLEVIEVPNYSYLRIGAAGTEGSWVAVPTAGLQVGAQARVRDGMKMENFGSTALKRSFPVIYFGTLDGGRPAHGMAPIDPSKGNHHDADPHAAAGADPHAGTGLPPVADPDAMKTAHPAQGAQPTLEVKPVDRAKGPDARTVAELLTQRTQLSGKTVRIHATVVKSTPGIMGKTYLHLRDGSGDAAAGTHDIVVTTQATPAVGDVLTIEGTVGLDRDIGAGYKFATIVDDAKVLTP
jgi:hypothetical protein